MGKNAPNEAQQGAIETLEKYLTNNKDETLRANVDHMAMLWQKAGIEEASGRSVGETIAQTWKDRIPDKKILAAAHDSQDTGNLRAAINKLIRYLKGQPGETLRPYGENHQLDILFGKASITDPKGVSGLVAAVELACDEALGYLYGQEEAAVASAKRFTVSKNRDGASAAGKKRAAASPPPVDDSGFAELCHSYALDLEQTTFAWIAEEVGASSTSHKLTLFHANGPVIVNEGFLQFTEAELQAQDIDSARFPSHKRRQQPTSDAAEADPTEADIAMSEAPDLPDEIDLLLEKRESDHADDDKLTLDSTAGPDAAEAAPGASRRYVYVGTDYSNPYKEVVLETEVRGDKHVILRSLMPAVVLPNQGQDQLWPWLDKNGDVEPRYRLSDEKPKEVHPSVRISSTPSIEEKSQEALRNHLAEVLFKKPFSEQEDTGGYEALNDDDKKRIDQVIANCEADAMAVVEATREGIATTAAFLEVAAVTEQDVLPHEAPIMVGINGLKVKAEKEGVMPTLEKGFIGAPFGGPVFRKKELDMDREMWRSDLDKVAYMLDAGCDKDGEPLQQEGVTLAAFANTAVELDPSWGTLAYRYKDLNAMLVAMDFTVQDKNGAEEQKRLTFLGNRSCQKGQLLTSYGPEYLLIMNRHYLPLYAEQHSEKMGDWMGAYEKQVKALLHTETRVTEHDHLRDRLYMPWMIAAENRRHPGLHAEVFNDLSHIQKRLGDMAAGPEWTRGLLNIEEDHFLAVAVRKRLDGAVDLQIIEPAALEAEAEADKEYLSKLKAEIVPNDPDRLTVFELDVQETNNDSVIFSLHALVTMWQDNEKFADWADRRRPESQRGNPQDKPDEKQLIVNDCTKLKPDFYLHIQDPEKIKQKVQDDPAWDAWRAHINLGKYKGKIHKTDAGNTYRSRSIDYQCLSCIQAAQQEWKLRQQLRERQLRKDLSLVWEAQAIRQAADAGNRPVEEYIEGQRQHYKLSIRKVNRLRDLLRHLPTSADLENRENALRKVLPVGTVPTQSKPVATVSPMAIKEEPGLEAEQLPAAFFRPEHLSGRFDSWQALEEAYLSDTQGGKPYEKDAFYPAFRSAVKAFIDHADRANAPVKEGPQQLAARIGAWLKKAGKAYGGGNPSPTLALNNLAKRQYPNYRFKTHLGLAERVLTEKQKTEVEKAVGAYITQTEELGFYKHIKTIYRVMLETLKHEAPFDAIKKGGTEEVTITRAVSLNLIKALETDRFV